MTGEAPTDSSQAAHNSLRAVPDKYIEATAPALMPSSLPAGLTTTFPVGTSDIKILACHTNMRHSADDALPCCSVVVCQGGLCNGQWRWQCLHSCGELVHIRPMSQAGLLNLMLALLALLFPSTIATCCSPGAEAELSGQLAFATCSRIDPGYHR